MEKYITFEIQFADEIIEGTVEINSIDDDEPEFEYRFQPWSMNHQPRFPYNPFDDNNDKHGLFETMEKSFVENTDMIHQLLWDYQDENYEKEFEGFKLIINPQN